MADPGIEKELEKMKEHFKQEGKTPTEIFQELDEDGSGTLTYWEFYKGLKKKGFKIDQGVAEKLMKKLDVDGDGDVSLEEFDKILYGQTVVPKKGKKDTTGAWTSLLDVIGTDPRQLQERFAEIDEDGSGGLSFWEFSRGLGQIGVKMERDDMDLLMAEFDADGNGDVSIDEFLEGVDHRAAAYATHKADKDAEQKRKDTIKQDQVKLEERLKNDAADKDAADKIPAAELRDTWYAVSDLIKKKGSKKMRKIFDEFDEDGSGMLDRQEFTAAIKKLGRELSGGQSLACWKYLDPEDKGAIAFADFTKGLGTIDPEVEEAAIVDESLKVPGMSKAMTAADEASLKDVDVAHIWLGLNNFMKKGKASALNTFKNLDQDRSGELDEHEFHMFCLMLGIKVSDNEKVVMWRQLDEDGGGGISFQELTKAVEKRKKESEKAMEKKKAEEKAAEIAQAHSAAVADEVLKTAEIWETLAAYISKHGGKADKIFAEFDTDGDGTVSPEEFRLAMTMGPKIEMDDNTFHEVWNEMDYSGDGSVNFDEFKDAVGEQKAKVDAVLAGTWVPTEKDKHKEKVKKETAKKGKDIATKEKVVKEKKKKEAKVYEQKKAKGPVKKTVVIKHDRKALEMKAKTGRIKTFSLRLSAFFCLLASVASFHFSRELAGLLEDTEDYAQAGALGVILFLWAMVVATLQHWCTVIFFNILVLAGMLAHTLNACSNANVWYVMDSIVTECYDPSTGPSTGSDICEGHPSTSSTDYCICTQVDDGTCFEVFMGANADCSDLPPHGSTLKDALFNSGAASAGAAVLTFIVWFTVGCFLPTWIKPYGLYHCFFARSAIHGDQALAMVEKSKDQKAKLRALQDKRAALQKKNATSYDLMIQGLQKKLDDEGNKMMKVFKEFDTDGSGTVDRNELAAALSTLKIKNKPEDIDQLWGHLDQKGTGAIKYLDFGPGLKRAQEATTKNSAAGGEGDDPERGPGDSLARVRAAGKVAGAFGGGGASKQEAWNHLHSHMLETKKKPLALFRDIDTEKKQKVNRNDFGSGLAAAGINLPPEEIDAIWGDIDVEKAGVIGYSHFAKAIKANPAA